MAAAGEFASAAAAGTATQSAGHGHGLGGRKSKPAALSITADDSTTAATVGGGGGGSPRRSARSPRRSPRPHSRSRTPGGRSTGRHSAGTGTPRSRQGGRRGHGERDSAAGAGADSEWSYSGSDGDTAAVATPRTGTAASTGRGRHGTVTGTGRGAAVPVGTAANATKAASHGDAASAAGASTAVVDEALAGPVVSESRGLSSVQLRMVRLGVPPGRGCLTRLVKFYDCLKYHLHSQDATHVAFRQPYSANKPQHLVLRFEETASVETADDDDGDDDDHAGPGGAAADGTARGSSGTSAGTGAKVRRDTSGLYLRFVVKNVPNTLKLIEAADSGARVMLGAQNLAGVTIAVLVDPSGLTVHLVGDDPTLMTVTTNPRWERLRGQTKGAASDAGPLKSKEWEVRLDSVCVPVKPVAVPEAVAWYEARFSSTLHEFVAAELTRLESEIMQESEADAAAFRQASTTSAAAGGGKGVTAAGGRAGAMQTALQSHSAVGGGGAGAAGHSAGSGMPPRVDTAADRDARLRRMAHMARKKEILEAGRGGFFTVDKEVFSDAHTRFTWLGNGVRGQFTTLCLMEAPPRRATAVTNAMKHSRRSKGKGTGKGKHRSKGKTKGKTKGKARRLPSARTVTGNIAGQGLGSDAVTVAASPAVTHPDSSDPGPPGHLASEEAEAPGRAALAGPANASASQVSAATAAATGTVSASPSGAGPGALPVGSDGGSDEDSESSPAAAKRPTPLLGLGFEVVDLDAAVRFFGVHHHHAFPEGLMHEREGRGAYVTMHDPLGHDVDLLGRQRPSQAMEEAGKAGAGGKQRTRRINSMSRLIAALWQAKRGETFGAATTDSSSGDRVARPKPTQRRDEMRTDFTDDDSDVEASGGDSDSPAHAS